MYLVHTFVKFYLNSKACGICVPYIAYVRMAACGISFIMFVFFFSVPLDVNFIFGWKFPEKMNTFSRKGDIDNGCMGSNFPPTGLILIAIYKRYLLYYVEMILISIY